MVERQLVVKYWSCIDTLAMHAVTARPHSNSIINSIENSIVLGKAMQMHGENQHRLAGLACKQRVDSIQRRFARERARCRRPTLHNVAAGQSGCA